MLASQSRRGIKCPRLLITTTSSRPASGDDTDAGGESPAHLGNPDLRAAASGYLGLFLIGAALLSIGTLTSTFTRNQVVAAILAIAIGMGLWLVEFVGSRSPGTFVGDFLTQLGLFTHYFDFLDGIIDTQHVAYHLSLVAVSLFLATRVPETRRWR